VYVAPRRGSAWNVSARPSGQPLLHRRALHAEVDRVEPGGARQPGEGLARGETGLALGPVEGDGVGGVTRQVLRGVPVGDLQLDQVRGVVRQAQCVAGLGVLPAEGEVAAVVVGDAVEP
jgi:hypothetical protein